MLAHTASPAHIGQGSQVEKRITPDRLPLPSTRAACHGTVQSYVFQKERFKCHAGRGVAFRLDIPSFPRSI
jgi:hypothetical protein